MMSPEQQLANVERNLNEIYKTYRPFPYRWPGAPYSAHGYQQVDKELIGRELNTIQIAETSLGRSSHTLRLLGRANLLKGAYDEAAQNYRAATIRSPDDPDLPLELSISFALRAETEGRALDYERALETILSIEHRSLSPEVFFDTALLFEKIPLPRQAIEKWQVSINHESSPSWSKEAQEELTRLKNSMDRRERRLHDITASPSSYLAHAKQAENSLEVVVSEALENWLPRLYDSAEVRGALTELALAVEGRHKDPWLIDLLKVEGSPDARAGFEDLSESAAANARGEHIRALHLAKKAEKLFSKLKNSSGELISLAEAAYSLHRQFRLQECVAVSNRLRREAHDLHYRWIEGQAWLEQITCLTYQGIKTGTTDREPAYGQISQTGYTVLGLRARSFLTNPYASFGSRLRIWKLGCEGLRLFWQSLSPGLRAEQLYLSLATSARIAKHQQAALVLLREGALAIQDPQNRQVLAVLLADQAAWQSEAGLSEEASRTFDDVQRLFKKLKHREARNFLRETEIAHAQADIAAGHARVGLARLRNVTKGINPPYYEFPASIRSRLLPAFGDALLAGGELKKAFGLYKEAINQYPSGLNAAQRVAQPENLHYLEAAWRGLINVELRLNKFRGALADWEHFRSLQSARVPKRNFARPPGSAFLAYVFLPEGLSAWLATNNGIEQRWINSKTIISDCELFADLAADKDSPLPAVSRSAQRLYASLIAPFEAHLPPQGVLIVDADGPLAGIPWSALENDAGHALIERFGIAQVTGWGEAIPGLTNPRVDMSNLLIIANPTLGPELRDQFPFLPDALREAQRLQKRLPQSLYLHDQEANLQGFMQHLPSSTSFHFAGHGVSYSGFGALLLAPSSEDRSPTKLVTADEIMQLDLSHLQLIVLAACSAGEGEKSGVVSIDSLVRAFLQARARTVIASRWAVESEPTSTLMTQFYKGVISEQSPAAALRNAAIMSRHDKTHPFFWASFQVFGAP